MRKKKLSPLWRVAALALALSAVVLPLFVATRSADAIIAILIGLRSGPVGLTRGTEGTFGVYLEPNRNLRGSLQIVNTIRDGSSHIVLAQETQTLVPGGPCAWVHVKVFDGGGVQLNGRTLGLMVPEDGRLQLVSRVTTQAPKGTILIGSVQVTELANNRVIALLPYIEQEN